jgi:hypothetical protein
MPTKRPTFYATSLLLVILTVTGAVRAQFGTGLASPATIETLRDGRVSVYVVNPGNDDVRVYLRARERP